MCCLLFTISPCSFHPGFLTADRPARAKELKIVVTAGIASGHIDLNAAYETNGKVTVVEVTGSTVVCRRTRPYDYPSPSP